MSDPVIMSIIGGVVTVIQSILTIVGNRKTRRVVEHNAKTNREYIAAVHGEVQQLQGNPAPRLADGIRTSKERDPYEP